MADELTVTASMSCSKIPPMSAAIGRNISNALFDISSGVYSQGIKSFGTSEAAVPLGAVTSCGWSFFYNSDTANYVTIYNGAGGAVFLKLAPGEFAFCPLTPACVPYILANTAACLVEWLILSR